MRTIPAALLKRLTQLEQHASYGNVWHVKVQICVDFLPKFYDQGAHALAYDLFARFGEMLLAQQPDSGFLACSAFGSPDGFVCLQTPLGLFRSEVPCVPGQSTGCKLYEVWIDAAGRWKRLGGDWRSRATKDKQ